MWSPGFSSAFSVAGYHFHFLSEDRQEAGHLLECESGPLRLRIDAGPIIVGVHVDYSDNHKLFEMVKGERIH